MAYKDTQTQREYQRRWVAGRRQEFFADKACVRCGGRERLELDHIDPATKSRKSDNAIWSWSPERRNREIAKCQVLCNACHKAKTFGEDMPKMRGYTLGAHGLMEYKHRGCRCEVCRGANAERVRRQRARLRAGT